MLETTELHTILRLPIGIFYANGVKENVLFFDNHAASKEPWTKEIWYYDYRTNIHHTLKKKPLRFEDLQEFIADYNPMNRHERRESWNEATNPEARRERRMSRLCELANVGNRETQFLTRQAIFIAPKRTFPNRHYRDKPAIQSSQFERLLCDRKRKYANLLFGGMMSMIMVAVITGAASPSSRTRAPVK